MDILTVLGEVVAVGSILGGQALEGGHAGSIMQLTVFVIVMGGTIGACFVPQPLSMVVKSCSLLSLALFNPKHDARAQMKQVVELASVARRQGLLALEGKIKDLKDPFFAKGGN